jgi:polysaccharide pyruvyl transferase WcaK-like protein
MAECHAAFSMTLHGLILAAGCNVPPIGLKSEYGTPEFLHALGMQDFTLDAAGENFDGVGAAKLLADAFSQQQLLRERIKPKVQVLVKKEAQNARMLIYLVPRRDRMPPREDDDKKPRRKRAPRDKREVDPWFSDERFQ